MKKISIFFLTTLVLLAEGEPNNTLFSNLIGSIIPILIFFAIFIFVTRKMNKTSGIQEAADSNLELAQSNLKIASELKRIADILEKKEI